MIINAIKADNVLKYASLKLQDLPARGLIAITGANESGKSSIGETVCFALFGRTFSLDFDELTKIIRWDETHCAVELEFTPSDGRRYRLERFLDDAGNHSARLALADHAGAELLARGVEQVADKVYELIGYEFEEFIESFYLAQREITTPHPHSYAVKTMAGLVTLEYCAEACRGDQDETSAELEARRADLEKLRIELDELEIDPRLFAQLLSEHDAISRRIAQAEGLVERLDTASVDYQDALPMRSKALSSHRQAGLWAGLCLLLALLLGAGWLLLDILPSQDLALKLADFLSARFAFWQPEMAAWLLYMAVALAFLCLFFMFRRSVMAGQIDGMEAAARTLSTLLDELPASETVQAPVLQSADLVESPEVSAEMQESPIDSSSQAVDRSARDRLSQRIKDWQVTTLEVREAVGGEQHLLRQEMAQAAESKRELDQAIALEQARLDKAEQLRTLQGELRERISEREHHSDICNLADQLIQGAAREISYQFNRKLRGQVSKTLPLFTENRYEHLQIEDDLTVRAFSSEKRDFMDLDEISSGTQRQIMLAVRLALSQELVGRTVKGSQFLFLDEPFAFFDEQRTRSALTVLPVLSEELNQIWIIGQAFADDLRFDLHIRCERGSDSVTLPDRGLSEPPHQTAIERE
ncbi:MAG: AAA family ATPase [Chromatiales bacterium]|jgi:exonuclease SbcC